MERGVVSRWLVFASFLAGLVAFVWVHVGNYVETQRLIQARSAAGAVSGVSPTEAGILALAPAAAQYLVLALAGWAVARATTSSLLWLAPAMIVVLSPLPGALVVGEGDLLRPIGPFWHTWMWPVWRSALLDLLLVSLPGFAAVLVGGRHPRERVDGAGSVAIGVIATLAATLYLMARFQDGGTFDVNVEAHAILLSLFVTGVFVGARRPSAFAFALVLGVLASEAPWLVSDRFSDELHPDGRNAWHLAWTALRSSVPGVAAVGLGMLCDPLARYLRGRAVLRRRTAVPAS